MIGDRSGWLRGTLGLALLALGATWLTAAEVPPRDEEVLVESFDTPGSLPGSWTAVEGKWEVADGALVAEAASDDCRINFGWRRWQNYELEATATFLEVSDDKAWLALAARTTPDGTLAWPQVALRQKASEKNGVEFAVRSDDGLAVRQRAATKADCPLGQPLSLRVVIRNTTVEAYLNGQRLLETAYCLERTLGCPGLAAHGCRVRFDDVRLRRLPDTPAVAVAPQPCKVVAHRGFSALAPENTLAAYRKALEYGAGGAECDVRRTKDGGLVLMHDGDVKRTTNGSGKIAELTLEEIRALDAGSWKGAAFAGEKVPTFAEYLALVKDTGCTAVVEIKAEGIAAEVVEMIRQADMVAQCCVISFDPANIKAVRQREPKLRCAWLVGGPLKGTPAERAESLAQQARDCDAPAVSLDFQIVSPELIQELKQRGLGVACWTVNEPIIATALSAWGVDTITTDRLDALRAQLPAK